MYANQVLPEICVVVLCICQAFNKSNVMFSKKLVILEYRQRSADQCLTTGSLGVRVAGEGKLSFVAFTNSCGINTPIMTKFKLPT